MRLRRRLSQDLGTSRQRGHRSERLPTEDTDDFKEDEFMQPAAWSDALADESAVLAIDVGKPNQLRFGCSKVWRL